MKMRLLAIVAPLLLTAAAPAPMTTPGPDSEGTFKPWRTGAKAVTYDTEAVPFGARARVVAVKGDFGVRVSLVATGLKPGRAYGAHLHTSPCGKDPAAAGPHYQYFPDPAAGPGRPSVDPEYANRDNEVWLDFVANRNGVGRVSVQQNWNFDESRAPWSLVLHAEHTHTKAGEAGTAGARLACLTRDTTTG